jgi:hypothetical protein
MGAIESVEPYRHLDFPASFWLIDA